MRELLLHLLILPWSLMPKRVWISLNEVAWPCTHQPRSQFCLISSGTKTPDWMPWVCVMHATCNFFVNEAQEQHKRLIQTYETSYVSRLYLWIQQANNIAWHRRRQWSTALLPPILVMTNRKHNHKHFLRRLLKLLDHYPQYSSRKLFLDVNLCECQAHTL